MSLSVNVNRGLVLIAASPYDATIVDAIRRLPQRRYRATEQDWIMPARREHLRALCIIIAELSEHGYEISLSAAASERLAHMGIGWGMLRDDTIHIAGPYSKRRLPALRALAERRFDPHAKVWVIPLTRASALHVLALLDSGALVLTDRAHRTLKRTAAPIVSARDEHRAINPLTDSTRRSPVPHWRHLTSGPVFDNPARPRIDVPGIGLCVRIRVNPRTRGRQGAPLDRHDS